MLGSIRTRVILWVSLAFFLVPLAARDAAGAKLIRDTEVENTIRAIGSPLFEAAGLRGNDIRIFIIGDETVNAFVAGGLNLFINTGLLRETKNVNQLAGVIAHETGHMAGGHLVRFSGRVKSAGTTALVTTILGVLAAVATGSGKAGSAITLGGQGLAVGSILAYSRAQEAAADQAGMQFLDDTGQSVRGLRDFFKTLEDQELLPPSMQNPYVRTHPITRFRIQSVENHLAHSRYKDAKSDPRLVERFKRMKAKLFAYLDPAAETFRHYPRSDTSIAARYARAIAYYRQNDLKTALPLFNGLIKSEPRNPYFHEIKGQALLEAGRIKEALGAYELAAKFDPESGLIRLDLARTQLAMNRKDLTKAALDNLLFTTRKIPEHSMAWQQLAIAYGRNGQIGMSNVASAEYALRTGMLKDAQYQAARAKKKLPAGSAGRLRAEDILELVKRELKERHDRR